MTDRDRAASPLDDGSEASAPVVTGSNLVPSHIDVCSTCGYGAPREFYPCYRCGQVGITRFVPCDDAAVERAAFSLWSVNHGVVPMKLYRKMARVVFAAAANPSASAQDPSAERESPEGSPNPEPPPYTGDEPLGTCVVHGNYWTDECIRCGS